MNFTISKKSLIIYGSLFGAAVLLGIIVGCCGKDAGIGLYTTLAIAMLGLLPIAKKVVLWVGRKAVDFATTLDFVFVMTILYSGIYYKSTAGSYGDFISYGWFVLAAFLYMVLAALKNYVLYLIIDIRDSLHKLAHGADVENPANEISITIADDLKQCPKCGQMIKKTAKKCRYCGEWLNEENKGDE